MIIFTKFFYYGNWVIFISDICLMIISALDKSWLPELGLAKSIQYMPASLAAMLPFLESSRTTQSLGLTCNFFAVFK